MQTDELDRQPARDFIHITERAPGVTDVSILLPENDQSIDLVVRADGEWTARILEWRDD